MAFLITCSMMLFLSTMSSSMGIVLTEENINTAAVLTFWNVVFLSFVCTIIDAVRRRITVERPVKKIVEAAERIAKGDYHVKIEPINGITRGDGLDRIVACCNKMASELSGIETMQSDFISNVSHEIKTPLSVIESYGTLLAADTLDGGDRVRYANAINKQTRKLSELISNILRLSKLENREVFPNKSLFDLGAQVAECLVEFENIWEKKSIEISVSIDDGVLVSADKELLSLIWNNLISNALKFTNEGGKVSVSVRSEGENAVVSVADTGCGIQPEVGKHIFEKFYQGDTSHKTEGNGLGLALVKRVADIVGGEIEVNSTPGVGSVFTFKLIRASDESCEKNN